MPKRKRKDHGPTEWAEEIRNLREKLGISQGELARKLDCSAMTVSRWENGQLAPTARYYIELGKLAGAAPVKPAFLLAGEFTEFDVITCGGSQLSVFPSRYGHGGTVELAGQLALGNS